MLRAPFYSPPPTTSSEPELYGIEELWDGHSAGWLEHDTLLAQSGGAVSSWTDIANGRVFLPYTATGAEGTASNYPTWTAAGGVVFDGVDDVLKHMVSGWTSFGTVYAVVKQLGWTNSDVVFAYAGTGGTRISQANTAEGGSPNLHLANSSGLSPAITGLPIGTWGLLTMEVDGAASTGTLQLNDGTPVSNNLSMTGYTSAGMILGATHAAPPALQRYGNVAIFAIIWRDQIDDPTTKAAIKAYLTGKYL